MDDVMIYIHTYIYGESLYIYIYIYIYICLYIHGATLLQTSLKLKTKHQNKKFIDHIEIFNYGMEIDCWEMKKNTVKSDFKKK